MSFVRGGVGLAALLFAMSWTAWAADKKPAAADKPAVDKPAEADRFAVPDGTPKELVAYITKLIGGPPPRDVETRDKMRAAILLAAERILAGKPNDAEREFGVQAKMNMLEKPEQLKEFAAQLKKGGHDLLARQVEGFILQVAMRNSLMGGREAMKKAIDNAVRFLETSPPQPSDVGLAFLAGRLAEMSEDNQLALSTYASLSKIFSASKDEKLVEFAGVLEGVARRLGLVGHEMKIEGKLLDGSPFDWSKYLGKVVLVDFWATWCGPCVAEIPGLLQTYDLYRDKGFEIVGISVDRRRADLEQFVKEKKIPWPVVFGDNDQPSPTAAYYGVLAVPTSMLVGRDGKVASLSVRGDALRQELEKMLGPAEEKKPAKNPSLKLTPQAPAEKP